MESIQKLDDNIFYFKVPYKDIFVGIYVIQIDKGAVLFDTAACNGDVDSYIMPALQELGIIPAYIFISHDHRDHAGGIARAAELWPETTILSRSERILQTFSNAVYPEDGQLFLDTLQVVAIPGHTADAAALLDLRTNTLITGDCLQSYGIYGSGAWYGAIVLTAEHLAAVCKLRTMPIAAIATAHDYHPVGMISRGADEVKARLDSCVGALDRLRGMIDRYPNLNDDQLAQICNDGKLPVVAPRVIAALRKAIAEGSI